MIEKHLTTEQVSNILQVHPFTILKYQREGSLKGVKLGRVYRIKESDVETFLEERAVHGNKSAKKKPKIEESQAPMHKIPKNNETDDDHYYII